jgi:hypothetical protein
VRTAGSWPQALGPGTQGRNLRPSPDLWGFVLDRLRFPCL